MQDQCASNSSLFIYEQSVLEWLTGSDKDAHIRDTLLYSSRETIRSVVSFFSKVLFMNRLTLNCFLARLDQLAAVRAMFVLGRCLQAMIHFAAFFSCMQYVGETWHTLLAASGLYQEDRHSQHLCLLYITEITEKLHFK